MHSAKEEDGEIAFNLQVMEAMTASLGIDSIQALAAAESNPGPLGVDSMESLDPDFLAALRIQWSDIQHWQQEENDRNAARLEFLKESRRMRQIDHDRRLAQTLQRFGSVRDEPLSNEFDDVDNEYMERFSGGNGSNSNHGEVYVPAVFKWEGDGVAMEMCMICMEDRYQSEMTSLKTCSHRFCSQCVERHAEMKVMEGVVNIHCPAEGCTAVFSSNECYKLLTKKSSEMLAKRIRDLSIPTEHKVYCPYRDCSELMDKRDLHTHNACMSSSSSSMSHSSCVECCRCGNLFCLTCQVVWHDDMSCASFQSLPAKLRDSEGAKLHKLAKAQKWMDCSNCGSIVEHTQGCHHMTCRCGYQFCYKCGKKWSNDHVSNYNCKFWDEDKLITR